MHGSQELPKSFKLEIPEAKKTEQDVSKKFTKDATINEYKEVQIERNKDYLLTIKKELTANSLYFVEDDFTRDVIIQMAMGKRKVSAFRLKKSVQISEKEEVLIDKKSYFKDNCEKQYVHCFRANTKNL